MMSRRKRQCCSALSRRVAAFGLSIAALLALANLAARSEEGTPPEPDGYRLEDYRAPTPASLKGARTVDTIEAARLWRDKSAVFVDVMPHVPRPANLPAGTIWRDKPRFSIPGSAWLPDTGYGELAAATEAYLRAGLVTLTGGDRAKPLVIYCLRDCWMSWNAAKRAASELGYTDVYWYPLGVQGWKEAGLNLEPAHELPMSGPTG
jgi:PQQ-dependent catabolism-associated CXXCW motif protein